MFSKAHQFLIEFSSSTTVHGINYFGDRQRHWIERVFWIVVFVVSMSACIYTVHKTYSKWQSSPIIVTQDDKFTAMYEIPFPAVTVCPPAKIKYNAPVNLTRTQDELMRTANSMLRSGKKLFSNFKFTVNELEDVDVTEKEILLLEAVDQICPITNFAVTYLEDSIVPSELADTLRMYALDSFDVIIPYSIKVGLAKI